MTTRMDRGAGKSGKGRAKKLNKEAHQAVEDEAHVIAQALVRKAKAGDVTSARLLVELAEEDVVAAEVVQDRPLLKLAERLAAEPQWPRDTPDEDWDEDIDAKTEAEDREFVSA